MAIDRLPLGKLLELIQRPRASRLKIIERDARQSIIKEKLKLNVGGRDFYGDFWADAKLSISKEDFDLNAAIAERIKANRSRRRLYPLLLNGFQRAWSSIRDATTVPVPARLAYGVTAAALKNDDASVSISNLLVIRGGDRFSSVTYPYFSKDFALGTRTARLGLSVLKHSFPDNDNAEFALMDVLRGNVFFASGAEFTGSEDDQLDERYQAILREWRVQRRIHGGS
jgi:hypothetical protein